MKKIKGKNIIVIGGAGFIGSHLIEKLITNNNVVSIDNHLSGTEDNHFDGAKYIVGSCENISQLVRDFSPNLIFHLGEYSRVESSFDDY